MRDQQARGERVLLRELEVAGRVLGIVEDVGGDEREANVEIGESLVGVGAARNSPVVSACRAAKTNAAKTSRGIA